MHVRGPARQLEVASNMLAWKKDKNRRAKKKNKRQEEERCVITTFMRSNSTSSSTTMRQEVRQVRLMLRQLWSLVYEYVYFPVN